MRKRKPTEYAEKVAKLRGWIKTLGYCIIPPAPQFGNPHELLYFDPLYSIKRRATWTRYLAQHEHGMLISRAAQVNQWQQANGGDPIAIAFYDCDAGVLNVLPENRRRAYRIYEGPEMRGGEPMYFWPVDIMLGYDAPDYIVKLFRVAEEVDTSETAIRFAEAAR